MDAAQRDAIEDALPDALQMPLYTAKKQYYELLKQTYEAFDSLCNAATSFKDIEPSDETLELYEDVTKNYAKLDLQLANYRQHLETMQSRLANKELDMEEIDELCQKALEEPQFVMNEHAMYRKFRDAAGLGMDGEDECDVTLQNSESIRSTICPVTQLEIDIPLRNAACGHAYSEQGIHAHLQHSNRCPVAGCSESVSMSSIERDIEMEVLLSRRRNVAERDGAT